RRLPRLVDPQAPQTVVQLRNGDLLAGRGELDVMAGRGSCAPLENCRRSVGVLIRPSSTTWSVHVSSTTSVIAGIEDGGNSIGRPKLADTSQACAAAS